MSGSHRQAAYDGYIKREAATYLKNWSENFTATDNSFPVISFVPPTSGMFLWVGYLANEDSVSLLRDTVQIQVNFKAHPSFKQSGHQALELRLFTEFLNAGVLVAPGEHLRCF